MACQPDPFASPPRDLPPSQDSEWKRFRTWGSRNRLAVSVLALSALFVVWLAYGLVHFFLFDPRCESPSNVEAVEEECAERGTPVPRG